MTRDAASSPPSPRPQTPTEKARALAARDQADAAIALARFEALNRTRDGHRRRLALQQLGADPGTATPAGWAEQRAGMLVSAGSTAQPMTREQAEQERGRLLWVAVAKILGALIAAGAGLAIGIALLAGMAG